MTDDLSTRSTLLERVRDPRDTGSWREFVELYEPLLYRFIQSRGVPDGDASDIVQEVFTTLLRTLGDFTLDRGRGRFRTWLWTVSRNVMVDYVRRKGRRKEAEEEWCRQLASLRSDQDSLAEFETAHRQRVIEFWLGRLKTETQPTTWACFEQHIHQGRPAAAVAQELGLTPNAVYVNASRVLNRLRRQCTEFDEELSRA